MKTKVTSTSLKQKSMIHRVLSAALFVQRRDLHSIMSVDVFYIPVSSETRRKSCPEWKKVLLSLVPIPGPFARPQPVPRRIQRACNMHAILGASLGLQGSATCYQNAGGLLRPRLAGTYDTVPVSRTSHPAVPSPARPCLRLT
jgi:hypothetical protein